MKTIKNVTTKHGSVTLYEVNNQYVTLLCKDEREIPSIPSNDLATALVLFDYFVEQMEQAVGN